MLAVFAVGLALVPLTGGRLGNLTRVRVRLMWTVLLALAVQVLIIEVVPDADGRLLASLHMLSYAIGAVFVVANRRLFGMFVIALGAASNALVITANGGVMPADQAALARAGWATSTSGQFENSEPIAHAKLPFLGDIFALPAWVPLANVFSVGDLLIMVGGILVVHWICESRLLPPAIRSRLRPPLVPAPGAPPPAGANEAGPERSHRHRTR